MIAVMVEGGRRITGFKTRRDNTGPNHRVIRITKDTKGVEEF